MSADDLTYAQGAIKNWKRLRPAILEGDMYRLFSPYDGAHASTGFVSKDKSQAVVFVFDTYPRYGETTRNLVLKGLNEDARYRVKEINLEPNKQSRLRCNNKVYSGQYLMTVGIQAFSANKLTSHVLELTKE